MHFIQKNQQMQQQNLQHASPRQTNQCQVNVHPAPVQVGDDDRTHVK